MANFVKGFGAKKCEVALLGTTSLQSAIKIMASCQVGAKFSTLLSPIYRIENAEFVLTFAIFENF